MSTNKQKYVLTWSDSGIECEKIVEERFLNATLDMLLKHYSLVVVERLKVVL